MTGDEWICYEGLVYETAIRPADDGSRARLHEAVSDLNLGHIVKETRQHDGTVMTLIYTTITDRTFRNKIQALIPEMAERRKEASS